MSPKLASRFVLASVIATLVGLGFMMWGLFGSGPIPIFLSMSLGQMIGTGAFALYLLVVVLDLWHMQPAQEPTAKTPVTTEAEPAPGPEKEKDEGA